MNGAKIGKKPTYRELQFEISQLAGFMQKISTVLLQMDDELVGLRNELEENKTIKSKAEREAERAVKAALADNADTETQGQVEVRQEEGAVKEVVTEAKLEDYFPTKVD